MRIEIRTFDMGTTEEKARKVCEEAMEFFAEHQCSHIVGTYPLMLEIGDVFTALANYCQSRGIDAQECIDLVETKNITRGRYDTIEP